MVHTDDCQTDAPNQHILKYSDDMVSISLLKVLKDSTAVHQHGVNQRVKWWDYNAVEITQSN